MNRRNVSKIPKENFDACDDFLNTIVDSHIIAAAIEHLGMKSVSDSPSQLIICNLDNLSKQERSDTLLKISRDLVSRFVNLKVSWEERCPLSEDGIFGYACKLLSIGLFYREYCDGIREGDGLRVLRCWRYLFLIFRATGRKNYAFEAFNMLVLYQFILSPRQSCQLLWSRFVNVHGVQGKNIPADLFMEHLNRLCKNAVENLGANKTEKAIQRVGKVIGVLETVISNYDNLYNVTGSSGRHKRQSCEKDVALVLEEITKRSHVFSVQPGRSHSCFKTVNVNIIGNINLKDLQKWMIAQMNYIVNGF